MKKNIYFVFIPEEVQANVHAYEFPILEKIQETWGAGVDNKVVCIRPAKPNKVAETIQFFRAGMSRIVKPALWAGKILDMKASATTVDVC